MSIDLDTDHRDEILERAEEFSELITPYGGELSKRITKATCIYMAYLDLDGRGEVTIREIGNQFDVSNVAIRDRKREISEEIYNN